ncbi:MAG: ABC transporter permease [Nitrospinaceae bacterium]|jgi:ABC-type nitrate/sulfonate/bicarbonate transport system permease component|nr:ABC transporter permease [Nitrospinaceae bacterium]MBT5369649.1 ABC transporter permease [Nitrospinaceae bacterium]MBT5946936.1 ABC transporter permease [Nitrospinaceae bacterium]MBT6394069.1 ABC transporter permease [Nitrospinaceae bacterium]
MKELSVSKSAGDSESGGVVRLLPGAWRGRAVRLLSLGGFLFLWQAVAWTGKFTPYQVPSPTLVASTFTGLLIDGDILYFLSHSLRHYSIGLAWGISVGIAVGLIMAWFRQAEQVLEPIITALRPIPPLAWIPFAIIWFGITTQAAAFLISLGAFYITLFATYGAVKAVDSRLVEVARTLGEKSDWAVLRRVILPASMPGILTGVRTSLGQGWMTVVAAEMFGIKGIGMQMLEASGLLAMDVVISYMIVIGIIYFFLDTAFKAIESHLLRWR